MLEKFRIFPLVTSLALSPQGFSQGFDLTDFDGIGGDWNHTWDGLTLSTSVTLDCQPPPELTLGGFITTFRRGGFTAVSIDYSVELIDQCWHGPFGPVVPPTDPGIFKPVVDRWEQLGQPNQWSGSYSTILDGLLQNVSGITQITGSFEIVPFGGPPSDGSCCFADRSCSIESQVQCEAGGGFYIQDAFCPAVEGACFFPTECDAPSPESCLEGQTVFPEPIGEVNGTGIAFLDPNCGTNTYLNNYVTSDIGSGTIKLSCIEVGVSNTSSRSVQFSVGVLSEDLSEIAPGVPFCVNSGFEGTVQVKLDTPLVLPTNSFYVALTKDPVVDGFATFATTDQTTASETLIFSEFCEPLTPVNLDNIGFPDLDMKISLHVSANKCSADLNGDDSVSFGDLLNLLSFWGPCNSCPQDLDSNSTVDFQDLIQLLSLWGPCTG